MHKRLSVALLALPLACVNVSLGQAAPALPLSRAGTAPAATPATTPVEAAIQEFGRLQQVIRSEGKPYNAQVAAELIDTAFEQINLSKLTVEQIRLIVGRIPVQTNAGFAQALEDRLVQLSEATGAAVGPLAARIQPAGVRGQKEAVSGLLVQLLEHPDLGAALKGGTGVEVFSALPRLTAEQQVAVAPKYAALAGHLTGEVPDTVILSGGSVFSALPRQLNREQLLAFAPLRKALLDQVTERLGAAENTPARTTQL